MKDKETLSNSFYNMEKLDCFNPKSVTNRVRGFISDLKGYFCLEYHYPKKCKCLSCRKIDKLAGEELANHSPQVRSSNQDFLKPEDTNSPQEPSRLKGKPGSSEDTRKGCGKEFGKFLITNIPMVCGKDGLCLACSGDGK